MNDLNYKFLNILFIYNYYYNYLFIIIHSFIYTIAKSIGSPLLMNRFDYFSNFYEYKS